MTTAGDPKTVPAPSPSRLAMTMSASLVIAGVLLVAVVLPAEYAIDPLGIGRRLGLTEIASPSLRPAELLVPAGAKLAPVQKGAVGEYRSDYALDVVEITLPPYDYVEYKYQLEKGATMLYSWHASAALIQDFHGERATGEVEGAAEESFDKQDRREASGSLTAPFNGIHGWYWENPGGQPVTIRLTSAGFFSAAVEIRSDRSRHTHRLRTLDTLRPINQDPAALQPRATGEPK